MKILKYLFNFALFTCISCKLENLPFFNAFLKENKILLTDTINPTSSTPTGIPTLVNTYYPSSVPTGIPTLVNTYYPSSVPTGIPTLVSTYYPSSIPTCIPTLVSTHYPSSIPTWRKTNIPTIQRSNMPTKIASQILDFQLIIYISNYQFSTLDESGKNVIILATSKSMNISSSYILVNDDAKFQFLNYNIQTILQIKIPIQGIQPIQLYNNIITQFKSSYLSGEFYKNILDSSIYYNNPYFSNINITNITFTSPIIINNYPTLNPTPIPYSSNNNLTFMDSMNVKILIIIICTVFGGSVLSYLFLMYFNYRYKNIIKNDSINILSPLNISNENDVNITIIEGDVELTDIALTDIALTDIALTKDYSYHV